MLIHVLSIAKNIVVLVANLIARDALTPKESCFFKIFKPTSEKTPIGPLSLIGLELERLVDFQGRAGITSILQSHVRPVIFGVERFIL